MGRMAETKNELHSLFGTESLRHVPFAVLGNKIDIPTACSSDELRQYLQLPVSNSGGYGGYNDGGVAGAQRNGGGLVEVFMVSLVNKMGYSAAFKWISDVLKAQSKN